MVKCLDPSSRRTPEPSPFTSYVAQPRSIGPVWVPSFDGMTRQFVALLVFVVCDRKGKEVADMIKANYLEADLAAVDSLMSENCNGN
jgi:hypothetical protein